MKDSVTIVFDLHDSTHVAALESALASLRAFGPTDAMASRYDIQTPEQLVKVLLARPGRNAYQTAGGNYAVDYQGGMVSRAVIDEAERLGLISRAYVDQTVNAWKAGKP